MIRDIAIPADNGGTIFAVAVAMRHAGQEQTTVIELRGIRRFRLNGLSVQPLTLADLSRTELVALSEQVHEEIRL